MRFATISTMLVAAATQAVFVGSLLADGRGHGSFGMSHGGNSQGSAMRTQQMPTLRAGGLTMKMPSGNYTQVQKQPLLNNVTRFPGGSNGLTKINTPILKARDPGFGQGFKKPIDLGIARRPSIDPGFGQGKKPIDVIKKPILDPGIGNGKKPIDIGIGNGGIKVDPGLIGKIKTPLLPFNPGVKIPVGPKIPICPPHKFPNHPHHWCPPCPPIFLGWCWYPGWGNCYGYAGGLGLPVVATEPVIVQLPPADTLVNGAMPQIVPGTTVVANVTGAGDNAGRIMMQYNAVALPAEIVKWEGDKVTFVVPAVALQQPVVVKLVFLRADGEMAQEVNAELVAVTVEQQP